MREHTDTGRERAERSGARGQAASASGWLGDRVIATPGVTRLVAEAEMVWRERAEKSESSEPDGASADARPGWRSFEDAFPTFYQFTNRPPR